MLDIIPLHPNLVTPNHRLEAILLTEPLRNIRSKLQAYTSLTRPPPGRRLRIRPEHLHHEPLLTRLTLRMTIETSDVIQRDIIIRKQPPVQRQEFLPDQRRQRQRRETLRE